MNFSTAFHFTMWVVTKLLKTIFQLPMKFHKNYMAVYQDSRGAGTFAWFIVSAVIIAIAGASALGIGDTVKESVDNMVFTVCVLTGISLSYYITCVLIDQYEQFQSERERTWKTLKD